MNEAGIQRGLRGGDAGEAEFQFRHANRGEAKRRRLGSGVAGGGKRVVEFGLRLQVIGLGEPFAGRYRRSGARPFFELNGGNQFLQRCGGGELTRFIHAAHAQQQRGVINARGFTGLINI